MAVAVIPERVVAVVAVVAVTAATFLVQKAQMGLLTRVAVQVAVTVSALTVVAVLSFFATQTHALSLSAQV